MGVFPFCMGDVAILVFVILSFSFFFSMCFVFGIFIFIFILPMARVSFSLLPTHHNICACVSNTDTVCALVCCHFTLLQACGGSSGACPLFGPRL